MALLAGVILDRAAYPVADRPPLVGLLAALLLHGGVALAVTHLIEARPPEQTLQVIEVIWPAPAPSPVPAAMPARAETQLPQQTAAPEATAAAERPGLSSPPEPQQEPVRRETGLPEPVPEPLPAAQAKPLTRPRAAERQVTKPAALPAPATAEAPAAPAAAAEAAPAIDSAPAIVMAAPPAPAQMPAPAPATTPARPPYGGILHKWLERYHEYPRAARLRRQEGEVKLLLVLDRSGQLLDASITTPSSHALLNEATSDLARRAAPFPPPTDFAPGQERGAYIIPVRYRIQE